MKALVDGCVQSLNVCYSDHHSCCSGTLVSQGLLVLVLSTIIRSFVQSLGVFLSAHSSSYNPMEAVLQGWVMGMY
jgi:hypothetical protein